MPDYQLYRADDGLALTIRVTEMVIEQVGSTYVLRAPGGIGAITLIHQPQHTLEIARKSDGTRPPQTLPLYAPPSNVTYLLFSSTKTILFTVEGILDAVARLPLHKHPESPFAPALRDPAALLTNPVASSGTPASQTPAGQTTAIREARAQARTGALVAATPGGTTRDALQRPTEKPRTSTSQRSRRRRWRSRAG